jgi:hypothetical protein
MSPITYHSKDTAKVKVVENRVKLQGQDQEVKHHIPSKKKKKASS